MIYLLQVSCQKHEYLFFIYQRNAIVIFGLQAVLLILKTHGHHTEPAISNLEF